MEITRREVEQIAELARLALTPEEVEGLRADLGSILGHVHELRAAEVEGVAPMGGVSEHPAPMREDASGADALRLPLDEISPSRVEGFFTVPRLAALDADALADEGGSA